MLTLCWSTADVRPCPTLISDTETRLRLDIHCYEAVLPSLGRGG